VRENTRLRQLNVHPPAPSQSSPRGHKSALKNCATKERRPKQDEVVVLNLSKRFPHRGPREHGFTLLESLVALAILTAGLAAIGQLGFSSLAAARRAEKRLELTSAARAALTALPDRRASRNGAASGQILNAQWRLDAAPFPYASAAGPIESGWTPQILELQVKDPAGGTLVVETVRLRRGAP
jgi:general secretion pathway protein I